MHANGTNGSAKAELSRDAPTDRLAYALIPFTRDLIPL